MFVAMCHIATEIYSAKRSPCLVGAGDGDMER
jgi:hypothetical protein